MTVFVQNFSSYHSWAKRYIPYHKIKILTLLSTFFLFFSKMNEREINTVGQIGQTHKEKQVRIEYFT